MKKIYLLILLAASMCFASLKVVGTGYKEPHFKGVSFKITNQGGSQVKGFKITAYIETCLMAKGMKIHSSTLAGGSVSSLTRLTSHLYKVVFDFSKQTIPANGAFPSDGSYLRINLRNAKGTTMCPISAVWSVPAGDQDLPNFVVTNTSGNVLWGKPEVDDGLKRVGILYGGRNDYQTCGASYDKENTITLDTEDKNPKTRIVSGNTSPYGIEIPSDRQTIKFSFCNEFQKQMPQMPYDYIVLKLDNTCPQGAYEFSRRHDTEDSNNKNATSGDVWPNVVDDNATLYFCFIPKKDGVTRKYPVEKEYGIFANPSTSVSSYIVRTEVHVDDEDSNNNNKWNFFGASKDIQNRIKNIIGGSDNTDYHVVKWTGSASAMAKSANAENAQMQYVAATPLAPAVKGLNRNAVAVELKSVGDVKVSIVGVNGAVIANISEKNLQAGSHQIKWNAGMVPSGRYIVKIEQNGMVNAKNVILK
ncbi:MAG: hypothetical protein IJM92_06715 [Fibrobacter sp.]|uniref:hypothetical protein n=1 Tax=Fibrobacter sp. TaxID=35828 RepID=UPI0025C214E9|nr:hypothetical protein [Fibrobacter sp.]MBQ7079345.1 hypothetical protein [Fibrobacter sp.]